MDAIKLILVMCFLIIPFALVKLWWWVGFWIALIILLGIVELISFLKDKKTISQRFWVWKEKATFWQKFSVAIGMIVFYLYLLSHLYLEW